MNRVRIGCVRIRMTSMGCRWIALLFAMVCLSGCWTVRDYGMGKCHEYKPSCPGPSNKKVCVIDSKGCEVCNCVETNGEFPLRPPHNN